jgi:uncharacterized membrane protein YedE/YeeE
MNTLLSFLIGSIFGLGLIVAGMANPAKVQGFLDITGLWDPSLAFVMGGGIAIASVAFAIARKRTLSLLGFSMQLPTARHIDRRLVLGSLMFGMGWGIAGICPGPGFVLLGTGSITGMVFVAAMLAGMGLFEGLEQIQKKASSNPVQPLAAADRSQ